MKLVSANVHALDIPFVEEFSHSAQVRVGSDSVVVRVVSEDGIAGFGEGAARPYVTGETPDVMVEHLVRDLWPKVAGLELPDPVEDGLGSVGALIPEMALPGVIAPNAARCALELATLDCILRATGSSLATLLPPRREVVAYGGVITAGSIDAVVRRAHQMKIIGLKDVKLKVGVGDDVERVRAVRQAIGPDVSLRLDANGAWNLEEALQILLPVAPFTIAAVEQPLPRGAMGDLKALRDASPSRSWWTSLS